MIDLDSRVIGSEPLLTQKNQLWVRESVLLQELSLNQRIKIHILFPSMEFDYLNLVIQFLNVWV